jgi:hypothetical protein
MTPTTGERPLVSAAERARFQQLQALCAARKAASSPSPGGRSRSSAAGRAVTVAPAVLGSIHIRLVTLVGTS